MPRVGFEPTISAGVRPKTYALDRAATGTVICAYLDENCISFGGRTQIFSHLPITLLRVMTAAEQW